MARKRAKVNAVNTEFALGTDILDRILETENLPESEKVIFEIPLAQIDPNPYQTRRHFEESALEELAASIRSQGFYGYLLARPAADRYQIAYGERRFRAANLVGLNTLPLVVRDFSDEQMMEVAITENVIREDLNPMEEAEAYRHLADAGYSLSRISERVGKSKGHISNLLSLLKIPDLAEALRQERVGLWAAREMARVENEDRRQDLLNRTARGEFNREALRTAVRLALQEAEYEQTQDILLKREDGEAVRLSRLDSEDQADESMMGSLRPAIPKSLIFYDPVPNLRVALSRLEKVRADRFNNIDTFQRGDVSALLREIVARAQHLLHQLEDPWTPPKDQ